MYKDIAMLFVLVSSKTVRSIINLGIWHGVFSEFTSFVKWWRIIFFGAIHTLHFHRIKRLYFYNFFSFIGPLSYGGSYKITCQSACLSVYPSVHPSVRLSIHLPVWCFFQKWLISFFWFLARWYLIGISKNWLSSFFPGKFVFAQIWGLKMDQK